MDLEGEGSMRVETGNYRRSARMARSSAAANTSSYGEERVNGRSSGTSAASPAPAAAQAPACPHTDRVGFPANTPKFELLGVSARDKKVPIRNLRNSLAAAVSNTASFPIPNGSVIVMEYASL